jgi:hypothetical protein
MLDTALSCQFQPHLKAMMLEHDDKKHQKSLLSRILEHSIAACLWESRAHLPHDVKRRTGSFEQSLVSCK